MSWAVEAGPGVRLRVHVQPRATRTEVAGLHGDAVKIRLAAPPVDGAANEALIDFLSHQLDVSRRAIALISGHGSRAKTLEITGLSAGEVRQRLRL